MKTTTHRPGRGFAAKSIATVCALALTLNAPAAKAGDLNSEMNDLFNSLGGLGNVTEPGAFKGQTFNTFTGGNLFYRNKSKTYQLAALQFPSMKAGCGGIDIFGGAFSFISAAELKNALKNITSALPGVAFQLAVEAVSPLLGGIISKFKALEQQVNSSRINSCEAATGLVSKAAAAFDYDSETACRKIAMWWGISSDYADATKKCQTGTPSILGDARKSGDAELQNMPPFAGNLVWEALKKIPTLDDQARELVMSITGTIIYPELKDTGNKDPEAVARGIRTPEDLLYGQSNAPLPGQVNIKVLKCDEYVKCLNVTAKEDIAFEPLTTRVEKLMRNMADKIRNRQKIPSPSAEVGLVNSTSLPVWRMLSIGTMTPTSGIADALISNYREVVAADFAFTLLSQLSNVGLDSLRKTHNLNDLQKQEANELREDLRQFMNLLQAKQTGMYQKLASVSSVTERLEQLERNLRSNMSSSVLEMLGRSGRSAQ